VLDSTHSIISPLSAASSSSSLQVAPVTRSNLSPHLPHVPSGQKLKLPPRSFMCLYLPFVYVRDLALLEPEKPGAKRPPLVRACIMPQELAACVYASLVVSLLTSLG